MAIDLLNIEPHKVSTDLSGYLTFIYGPPKCGKTTFGCMMPDPLLVAFEKGYNAIQGVRPVDITSWSNFKSVMRQLKKDEVRQMYKSIVIDTADIASDMCQKYICDKYDIENMGDGGWKNNSWTAYRKEFEETFRNLAQLGYAVVFISHDKTSTFTNENSGEEFQRTGSSLQKTALQVIENMCDIIGYAHPVMSQTTGESKVVLTLRSKDNSIRCGSRFKFIDTEIDFTYDALTESVRKAIETEAKANGNKYITNEREAKVIKESFDYDALILEFNNIVSTLMEKNAEYYGPKITFIVDSWLGQGEKVSNTNPRQAELIYSIIEEIKETYGNDLK